FSARGSDSFISFSLRSFSSSFLDSFSIALLLLCCDLSRFRKYMPIITEKKKWIIRKVLVSIPSPHGYRRIIKFVGSEFVTRIVLTLQIKLSVHVPQIC